MVVAGLWNRCVDGRTDTVAKKITSPTKDQPGRYTQMYHNKRAATGSGEMQNDLRTFVRAKSVMDMISLDRFRCVTLTCPAYSPLGMAPIPLAP